MYTFNESDWKLFKKLISVWKERFFDNLVKEYKNILDKDELSSEKFWDLSKKMSKDKTIILREVTKDDMVSYTLDLLKYRVIKESDLDEFSESFKAVVKGWHKHLLVVDP